MSRTATALLAALLATAPVLTACAGDEPTVSTEAGPVADAAPAAGAELDATAFAAALKRPDTVLLDVRTPEEFAEGHLPGAVNLDIQSPEFAGRIAALDQDLPYALYCRSGNRSAAAVQLMEEDGFTHLFHLGGGIGAWESAGGDVVTG